MLTSELELYMLDIWYYYTMYTSNAKEYIDLD